MQHRCRWSAFVAGAAALSVGALGLATMHGPVGAAPAGHTSHRATVYYISLGDSYSQGYRTPAHSGGPGYTDKVAKKAHMSLVNFGCGGATTTSLLTTVGCPGPQEPTHGVAYPGITQEQAALHFIAAHPGQIGLITVSISGNDVTACAGNASPTTCVLAASTTISTNVGTLLKGLTAALGANGDTTTKIVGLTYPDVILGDYVVPAGATNPTLAYLSTVAFDGIINPVLKGLYTGVANGSFVDVTSAPFTKGKINAPTGDDSNAYDSTTSTFGGPTVTLLPWGTAVPMNVAEVCELTFYCTSGNLYDIHPNTRGYTFITGLVLTDLGL